MATLCPTSGKIPSSGARPLLRLCGGRRLQWSPGGAAPPEGTFSAVPGGRLLEALLALPELAGEDDTYQVRPACAPPALLRSRISLAQRVDASIRWAVPRMRPHCPPNNGSL